MSVLTSGEPSLQVSLAALVDAREPHQLLVRLGEFGGVAVVETDDPPALQYLVGGSRCIWARVATSAGRRGIATLFFAAACLLASCTRPADLRRRRARDGRSPSRFASPRSELPS